MFQIKGSMDMAIEILLAISLSLCLFGLVQGHGRLIDPPSRSSMWRYGYRNPPNYNDNQLYCGGVQVIFLYIQSLTQQLRYWLMVWSAILVWIGFKNVSIRAYRKITSSVVSFWYEIFLIDQKTWNKCRVIG